MKTTVPVCLVVKVSVIVFIVVAMAWATSGTVCHLIRERGRGKRIGPIGSNMITRRVVQSVRVEVISSRS